MAKIKIHQLKTELGIESKDIIAVLEANGVTGKSHSLRWMNRKKQLSERHLHRRQLSRNRRQNRQRKTAGEGGSKTGEERDQKDGE